MFLRSLKSVCVLLLLACASPGCVKMGCSILDSSCSLLSLAIHPASGSLDTSFGAGNGFVEYNSPGGGANGQDVGQGVAIDASGRIYVSGVTTNLFRIRMFSSADCLMTDLWIHLLPPQRSCLAAQS